MEYGLVLILVLGMALAILWNLPNEFTSTWQRNWPIIEETWWFWLLIVLVPVGISIYSLRKQNLEDEAEKKKQEAKK